MKIKMLQLLAAGLLLSVQAETVRVFDPVVWEGRIDAEDYSRIDAISFEEGVETIEKWSVESEAVTPLVKISSTVKEIYGGFHFGVGKFEVDAGNTNYKVIDGALYKIEGYGYPVELVQVGTGRNGSEFSIPGTVRKICADAFANCSKITKVTIPASVEEIDEFIFAKGAVREIALDPANRAYRVYDGVLYTADGEMLVAYPQGRDGAVYTVREGTIEIGFGAFNSAKNLTKVVLPESVESIRCSAFSWASRLETLELRGRGGLYVEDAAFDYTVIRELDFRNRAVTAAEWAFGGAERLKKVYFGSLDIDWGGYIFEDSGVTDVYCADDSWYYDGPSPKFGKSLTIHTTPWSGLPNQFKDGGYTVKVAKDWNPAGGGDDEDDDEVQGLVLRIDEAWSGTGTLNGGGRHPRGKKVTLTAKAAPGSVFAGWFDANGDALAGSVDYRTAKFPYVVEEENTEIWAWFATTEEDAEEFYFDLDEEIWTNEDGSWEEGCFWVESLSLSKISVKGLPKGLKWDAKQNKVTGRATAPGTYTVTMTASNASRRQPITKKTELIVPNLHSGIYEHLDPWERYQLWVGAGAGETLPQLEVPAGARVTMKGLPPGMKWDARAGRIAGAPTRAGNYTVTITTKAGRETYVDTISITVEAMAEGMAGTYYGLIDGSGYGSLTVKVAANGKISATATSVKGTYSFSAKNWDWADYDYCEVGMTSRKGDKLYLALTPGGGYGCMEAYLWLTDDPCTELSATLDPDMLAKKNGTWIYPEAREVVEQFRNRTLKYSWAMVNRNTMGSGPVPCAGCSEVMQVGWGSDDLVVKIDGNGKMTVSGDADGIKVSGKGDVTRDMCLVVRDGREKKMLKLYFGYKWGEEWMEGEITEWHGCSR